MERMELEERMRTVKADITAKAGEMERTLLSSAAQAVTPLCSDALQILDSHSPGFGWGFPCLLRLCHFVALLRRTPLPRISAHADPGARGGGGVANRPESVSNFSVFFSFYSRISRPNFGLFANLRISGNSPGTRKERRNGSLSALACFRQPTSFADGNQRSLADLLGLIQKPIISADKRRPKPLQMKRLEFGPSVAPRLSRSKVRSEAIRPSIS